MPKTKTPVTRYSKAQSKEITKHSELLLFDLLIFKLIMIGFVARKVSAKEQNEPRRPTPPKFVLTPPNKDMNSKKKGGRIDSTYWKNVEVSSTKEVPFVQKVREAIFERDEISPNYDSPISPQKNRKKKVETFHFTFSKL
jgi:hypothetical protein